MVNTINFKPQNSPQKTTSHKASVNKTTTTGIKDNSKTDTVSFSGTTRADKLKGVPDSIIVEDILAEILQASGPCKDAYNEFTSQVKRS